MISNEILLSEMRRKNFVFEPFQEAVWPFRFRDITLYTEYEFDFKRYKIELAARYMNPRTAELLAGVIYLDRDDVLDISPEHTILYIAEEFFKLFRNRPLVEPESNVILGEN